MSYTDDNRYWQRWTITINGRTKEAVRNAMKKVTCNSFNLLRMDDIFSTSSGSTGIEDRKEGDKMAIEPMEACEVGYEPETVYEASVRNSTIHFMFSYREGVKRVSVMDAKNPGDWHSYHIGTTTELNYYVPNGTWILRIHVGCFSDWLFKDKVNGTLSTAIISRAWGRHYDTVVEDDIASCATTPKDAKKTAEWYKKLKEEVKGKMLQLIDVIFFNRKTKEIDYRKEIVAVDIEEAYMLAAQEYGKYDSKVHMRHANCLFSFIGDNEK